MEKYRMGGVFLTLIIALSVILMPCAAFADTATIPMYLTIKEAPIMFDITETIQMEGVEGSTDLKISQIKLTNNESGDDGDLLGRIMATKVEIKMAADWDLVPMDTDFENAPQNQMSLYLDFGSWKQDLSSPVYTDVEGFSSFAVPKGVTGVVNLGGNISGSQKIMSSSVATMVVTIEKTKFINFTVDGTEEETINPIMWKTFCEWPRLDFGGEGIYAISGDNVVLVSDNKPITYHDGSLVKATDYILNGEAYKKTN